MKWLIWLPFLIMPSPVLGGGPAGAGPREVWRALPAERRELILRNYRRYREMSPRERLILRGRYEEFKALPAPERESFIRRWQGLRGEARDGRSRAEAVGRGGVNESSRTERALRAAQRPERSERRDRGGRQFRGRD